METQVEFPELLYGPFLSVHRGTVTEARRWARAYHADGTFPPLVTRPVAPGTVIYTSDVTDLVKSAPQWRLYFVSRLADAVIDRLGVGDHRRITRAFEQHVLDTPWGALDTALARVSPDSPARLAEVVAALVRCWQPLDTLRYVGAGGATAVRLDDLVSDHYAGLLEMWLDRPRGGVVDDLSAAVSALTAAGPGERAQRLAQALAREAAADERLQADPRLRDPAWLESQVAELDAETADDLSTGNVGRLRGLLYDLSEDLSRGQPPAPPPGASF